MKVKFCIESEVTEDGEFQMFGNSRFLFPEHQASDHENKIHFLADLATAIDGYAFEDDEKLAPSGKKLKDNIIATVIFERD